MEWLWIIGGLFIFAVIFGVRSENKKSAAKAAQITAYSADIDAAKARLLATDNRASLPVLSSGDHGYRPVGKESLLAVQDGATRLEMKSTGRYKTGGTSVSIPIMKGVRYRVGSGSFKTEKSLQATDTGRLLVTDKAMVFEGRARNERITWTQIASVELLSDGFSIAKRSGPPRTFQVASPDPNFAAVVELMLARAD